MAAKLTEITTQYHKFEDNQVLTKDQLNEFLNYFEDQDRMSRIYLSGVGIVCGFELKINSSKTKITITQGVGVTTDGDLIKLQKNISKSVLKAIDLSKIEYTHFKEFEDSYAGYSFFKKKVTINSKKNVPINLWEILPEAGENTSPLSKLQNIDNKAVLLYLESYAKEGDLCTSIDCDNQGIEQVARLRVLLVSKTDAGYIAKKDSVYSKHDVADDYFKLPEVALRRVVLNRINAETYNKLKGAYYKALNDVNDKFAKNLTDGISKIVTDYDSLFKLNLPQSALLILKNKLKNILIFSGHNVPFNIQYRYDCLKDIVDTYNEIKLLLLSMKEECCPNIKAFPKHLLIGQIDEIQSFEKHNRHQFYKSPILNCGTNKIEQTKNLVMRLFEIIGRFQTKNSETKITPSNKLLQLTYRTIPFYYNVQLGLLKSWNYFKTEKNEQDTNLCYHTTHLSSAPQIQNPLNYNIDGYDFYRIEGHQGKNYKQVLEEIDKLKREHGLAFDVKALSVNINSENLNVDDYLCEFEDLNVLLRAWTAEQECILAEVAGFFSGFSTATPGVNVKEPQLNLAKESGIVAAVSETDTETLESRSTRFVIDRSDTRYSKATEGYKTLAYKKSEVISENLTTKEDALGNVMKVAFAETQGGSVNDIIAKSQTLVAEKVNTEEWNSKPEVKTFVIDQSIELMAYAHVLSQRMPNTLVDVSIAKVNTYKVTMEKLCKLVKNMKASYQKIELSVGLKAFIGIFINQLSTVCCSAKKLEVLLEEINQRKEDILLRLRLSKFVVKHPGLEHKAGVQPGGTFVLVYLNKEKTVEVEGNILRKRVADRVTTTNDILEMSSRSVSASSNSLSTLSRPVSDKITSLNSPLFEARSGSIIEMIAGKTAIPRLSPDVLERVIRPTDIPNNTVVADFSLPYMCCSDCAPVNFIIAKPPVSLRLEKDEFCLGEDTSPLIFDVSPEDGVIKADPEVTGMTIAGTKLSFDATLFPNEMLGKPIGYTVNDQVTECKITVYRSIQFDFNVPDSPTSETEITFIPTGNLDGATFLWSFGDDNLSTDRNPTHKYLLPVNDENKITVSLTVTAPNGVCQTTVEHEIEFVVEETKISLGKDKFCKNDENSYPFTVTPAGAEAKIEGSGVEPDNLGGLVFVPAKANVGEIEFILNGEPSGVKVTVQQAPVAKFVPTQVGNQLILTNNSTGADTYNWMINGKKVGAVDNSPHIINLTQNSPTLWILQLRAISKNCGFNDSEIIRFETKFIEEPPVNTCIEETKAAIINDLNILSKLQDTNSDFVQEIWIATSKLYGGTAQFKEGVLNDIDNYLAGKNNIRLETDFVDLLLTTSNIIVEIDRVKFKDDYDKLVQLFSLQLQLFYNILGCQDAATIKESADIIQNILNRIIEILKLLKEMKVILPNALKEFMKTYSEKVRDIELLLQHLKNINEGELI